MKDIFRLIPENEEKIIENYSVRRNHDFLTFSPSIKYKGQNINRIKIYKTTFQHFRDYTLNLFFGKLLPSINNRSYEETLHPKEEYQPSAYILSTTGADIFPNRDPIKNKIYKEKKQYRNHNIRLCKDEMGYYLEWPHLGPISKNKYDKDLANQAKERGDFIP